MLESIEHILSSYDISHYGFLPVEEPLKCLPDQYYQPWEELITSLPQLIASKALYSRFAELPVLSIEKLATVPECRRAYVILAFFAHAHIWTSNKPCEILPPNITVPLLAVSNRLGLPPTATYPGLNLWNCGLVSDDSDITDPENVVMRHTFTGTSDEEWFYAVSVSVEAKGIRAIQVMLECVDAVEQKDDIKVLQCLTDLTCVVKELGTILRRMHERCEPQVFYHRIRPFLAGSRGMEKAGLPKGVFYDEGDGRGSWRQYSGGSNAQSTLVQFLDIALGVKHTATGGQSQVQEEKRHTYLNDMRNYMPATHRRFLEHFSKIVNVQPYTYSEAASPATRAAFNEAVDAMTAFRDIHIQIVARYIVAPSRAMQTSVSDEVKNIASASSNPQEGSKELKGTGGTNLMAFLKQTRDETRAARTTGLLTSRA